LLSLAQHLLQLAGEPGSELGEAGSELCETGSELGEEMQSAGAHTAGTCWLQWALEGKKRKCSLGWRWRKSGSRLRERWSIWRWSI